MLKRGHREKRSMNTSEQLEHIEISIEQAKKLIDNKNALIRLTDNPDFKLLVLEGYFKEEASRLVLLKADPEMQKDTEMKSIEKSIDAIGYVRLYFRTIMQLGSRAEQDLLGSEQTREELLAEQLQ